jgi:hypothetical protein
MSHAACRNDYVRTFFNEKCREEERLMLYVRWNGLELFRREGDQICHASLPAIGREVLKDASLSGSQ